jgi:hypothetical protein
MRNSLKRILIALCLSALTPTTALAVPPRDRDRQANCPKGFYKYRGDCWRKIDAAPQYEEDAFDSNGSIDELDYDQIIEMGANPAQNLAPRLVGRR